MLKAYKKYKDSPEELKAALWYAVSNIGQKIAPWLVMFILTHELAQSEYGVYSVFMSWTEIFEIIVTLRIYSNGYVAGLVKADKNRNEYSATLQSLNLIFICFWTLIYFIFHTLINSFTDISTQLTLLMFLSFVGTGSFGMWSSRQRADNKYKLILFATLAYGFIGPVIGALSVFVPSQNPVNNVIVIRIILQTVIAIPFLISNYKGSTVAFNRDIAKSTLAYNIPLLPYYLSMVLLNHSDRLMIQKMDGYSEAAIYSVAYSVAMIMFIISGALNLSLQAWLFKKLKDYDGVNRSNLITSGLLIVSAFSVLELILAPELILIIGGRSYIQAIWVMPPITISVVVMFIYQQYVNVLFYFSKTKAIMTGSIISAVLNILLNAIFIPKFGYFAAGYTTFASYMTVLLLYLVLMKKTCKEQNIEYHSFFNIKVDFAILFALVGFTALAMVLYNLTLIRIIVFIAIGIVIFIKRKHIMSMIKMKD